MRYALVSDIHSNLQAWNAVLLDIRSMDVAQIICLGDIVGYGPNPIEVLQSVHSNVEHIILGNHDAVACGKIDPSEFHDDARKIINWTTERLNDEAKKFLATLPLTLAGESFRCAHGDFSDPGAFNYIIEPKEALPSWNAVSDQLLFVGHTHEPAIHIIGKSGTPHRIKPQDFEIETEKRYIINVGSVGQPRDKDARASYCIYDTAQNTVVWRRIPFDIDAYSSALHGAGISEAPSYFIHIDPRKDIPPIREIVNFAPAVSHERAVKDTVQVQQLNKLKSRIQVWKILSGLILTAGLAVALYLGYGWWKDKTRSTIFLDPSLTTINSSIYEANTNILMIPSVRADCENGIPGWNVKLADKASQHVKFDTDHIEGRVFTLSSETKSGEMSLISCPITIGTSRRMCCEALFKKAPSFSGNVVIAISIIRKKDGKESLVDPHVSKHPAQIRQGGWILAKQTFQLPANAVSLRLHIRGTFTGDVLVKEISLENKD